MSRGKPLFAISCPACSARVEATDEKCSRCGRSRAGIPRTEAQRLKSQPYRAHYKSALFTTNRPIVLRIAEYRCQWLGCGAPIGRAPKDWQCDHIVPVRDGGTDDLSNLQALCLKHAYEKTYRDRQNRL